MKPLAERVRGQHANPRRGELHGEREAVDAAADLTDVLLVLAVENEGRVEGLRPSLEELGSGVLGERSYGEDALAGHVEHGAARDQEGQPGRPRDELDVQRRCFSEVLGVVDDEQELA